MMFIGRDKKTGPDGAAVQSWKARRMRMGIWSGLTISVAHFIAGPAILTRSPKSSGSVRLWRVSCWPAVTTRGVFDTGH